MLAQLQSLLLKHNYIGAHESCYLSARLLGNWGILIYTSAGQYFHIKAEKQSPLYQEYTQLTRLYEKFSPFMAQPKGYHQWEGCSYLVNQAIAHEPFSVRTFLDSAKLQENLMTYFSLSFETRIQGDNTQALNQDAFDVQLFENPQSFICNHHIEHIQSLFHKLAAYGSLNQHGDFVLNNLGIHNNRIIIFDWEDYGRIKLPAYDLATFLISLFNFDVKILVEELYGNASFRRCVNHYMAYLDGELEDFIEYLPLYLYAFLYIKQQFGYSKDSIQRTQQSISQLYKLN